MVDVYPPRNQSCSEQLLSNAFVHMNTSILITFKEYTKLINKKGKFKYKTENHKQKQI